MMSELIRKYALPVPRYTSYPTAPQFTADVVGDTYETWLENLAPAANLSLYVHIPFCEALCWYCGCTTKATRQYAPVQNYLRSLVNEISRVTSHTRPSQTVSQIHWGGGSPNILRDDDVLRLVDALRAYFSVEDDVEFAVEVDPRTHTSERTEAFMRAGVTRLSIGVQDFDEGVQRAINRVQSFETTRAVIDGFRSYGVGSVNIDLVYGLPKQSVASTLRTIKKVLELRPDRIALFGYAHLPKRITHQRLISQEDLPDAVDRYQQSKQLAERLIEAGYVRIGLDHFALPTDPIATAPARRNFQGYTRDDSDALIGLGASAIGKLPQGYIQNATATHDYSRRVRDGGLAVVRGHTLSDEDRMRALVIERIMCDLKFPADELSRCFGERAAHLFEAAAELLRDDKDGLVAPSGRGFKVTSRGRPFVRTIAAYFDAYLERKAVLYSTGV
ncbi:MAG: oxygen-independent coproporphyrinogen III oxidase [Pseudomonadota bacterium]